MNKKQTCTFTGHSMFVSGSIFDALLKQIDHFALSTDEPVFLVGGMGEFDEMGARAVRMVKEKYRQKNICLCLVCPYMKNSLNRDKEYFERRYDEIIICDRADPAYYKAAIKIRNRYMIDCSSLLIAYVQRDSGGAFETLKYAKKQEDITVINLAEKMD